MDFRQDPSEPSPKGRGSKDYSGIHYRGGFKYAGLLKISRELRQEDTDAEQALWKIIKTKRFLGLKFRRQHQIGLYIVDFCCHKLKLIIELDGEYNQAVSPIALWERGLRGGGPEQIIVSL